MKAKKIRRKLANHGARLDALELLAAARILVDMDPPGPLVADPPTFDTGGWSADEDEGWRRYGVYL